MALDPQDLKEFTASIARFVRDRLIPIEAQVDAQDKIPDDVIAEMRKLGLFGMTLPVQYGGLELSASQEMQVVFELCYAAPTFRGFVGANNSLGGRAILWGGTQEQRDHYLPRIASGELLTAFALTEPGSGSDATNLSTQAVRQGDGSWSISGAKRYITSAPEADVVIVVARTEPGSTGGHGVSIFLVERGTPGMEQAPADVKMGQHGTHTGNIRFDNCVVPAGALLGEEGRGFKLTMRTIDRGRLHIGAASTGLAMRLIDEMLFFSVKRQQFGRPIADFQLVQAMLADSRAEQLAAKALLLQTAARCDRGEDFSMDAACCKMYASEMVSRVADRAVQVFGGAGYMQETAVERLFRDGRVFRIFEGTTQIQQITIARHMVRAAAAMH